MNRRVAAAVAAIVFSLTLSPFAQTVAESPVAGAVDRSIDTYPRFTVFDDVRATVDAELGIVTVFGKVTMGFKRDEIARRIGRIDGVREVRNDIEVLPVSIQDDTLRRKVARAIYSNPAFWRYAAMPNPPIHIVVENGHVTLAGVVLSEVDRSLARSLATGQGELSVINALRTDAQLRRLSSGA